MRITRLALATVTAALATLAFAPTIASAALLVNGYGLSFTGQARCLDCHEGFHASTTHSDFASATVTPAATAPGMWPAGRIGVGESVNAPDIALVLGSNTGLREYLRWVPADAGTANGPIKMAAGMEWVPSTPSIWELAATGITTGNYTCSQCHHLAVAKAGVSPLSGNAAGAAAPASNGWALEAGADRTAKASWLKGASIQCEACHGTGMSAESSAGGHWQAGVKIVGGYASGVRGQAASKRILDSQVCGQCHGTYKSGSTLGFTPDTTLTNFVTPFGFDAVPTRAAFEASSGLRASARFWPSGQNKAMKHSYYSEWTLSGHSHRGALTPASPGASLFQKADIGHFTSRTSTTCNRCHTGEGYLKRKGATIVDSWTESTAAAGQYGQECAVCHYAHKGDGSGLGVREPDGPGIGSNRGLSTGNTSLCEDCHNWQHEVQGTVASPVASGRGPSHPQREARQGRGLFDVPAPKAFMPGAKCEECHMPATKADFPDVGLERYADQSYKRYSHRMFIMMPGDAKTWGLAAWGDSCSPCHAGMEQDELQASIVEWQAQGSAANTVAVDAIAGAMSRSESSTPAGRDLLGRAFQNQKF
ncbi:MAG: hypothetical protein Q7W30_01655, partial [Coriobacteriia bacterium]|nr:hypothetical protein [Coriobacteriia bacterium]